MSRSRRSTGGDDMPGGVPKDVDDEHPSPAKPAAKRTTTNEAASKTSTSRPAPQQQKQQPASPTKERVVQQEKAAPKTEAKPQPKTEAKPQPKAAPKPQPKREPEPEPEPSDDEAGKDQDEEHGDEFEQDAQQAQDQGETAHEEEEAEVEEQKDAPVEKKKDIKPEEKNEPIEQKPKYATADKPKDSTAGKTKDVTAKKADNAEGVNGAAKEKGNMVDGAEPIKGGLPRRNEPPKSTDSQKDNKDSKQPAMSSEKEQREAEEARARELALGKFTTKPIAFPLEGDVTDAKAALDTFSLDLSRILIGLMRKPAAPVEIEVMQKNQRIREYNAAIRDRTVTRLLPIYNQKNVLQDGLYDAKEAGDGPHTIDTLSKLSPEKKKKALLTIRGLEKIDDTKKKAILENLGMTGPYELTADEEDLTASAARTIQLRIAMGLPATYSASG